MSEKKENSDHFNTSLKKEEEITRNTLSQFKRELEFYERSFNLAYDVICYLYDLTKSKKTSKGKFAIFCMLPRLFGTMQSIRILGLKGYYYDVAILDRTILENLGLCWYLARNEDEAGNWLTGKDISIPRIKLLVELVSLLSPEKKKEGKALYGELCNYVHANLRAVGPSFLTPSSSDEEIRVDVDFPPFYRKKRVPYISLYPIMLLIIIMEVFKSELGNKWIEKIWNIIREWESYSKQNQKNY